MLCSVGKQIYIYIFFLHFTQHLIYSELLTIFTVKIMVFMDLHKSLINKSVSLKVTIGEAASVRTCDKESISMSLN